MDELMKNKLFRNYSREMASLSTNLKLGMAFEENSYEEMGLPLWIRNVNLGAKRSVAEFVPRLDLSSVGSCSNFSNLFPNNCGFGSARAVATGFDQRTSSDDDHDGCSGPAASTILNKQSSAQLTIFYGGTVNVYDDIPADKAQAIMLMASCGNYSSYPHTKVKISEGSRIQHQPACCKVRADIPISRKHSVQRFLEKRKDRVNAKAKCPYKTTQSDIAEPCQYPSSSSYPVSLNLNSPSISSYRQL